MPARLSRLMRSDWGVYGTRGMVIASNFLALLVIASFMEAAEFGRFAFMWAATQTLSAIASVGTPNLMLRELSAYQVSGYQGITRGHAIRLIFFWPAVILTAIAGLTLAADTIGLLDPIIAGDSARGSRTLELILPVAAAAFFICFINVLGTLLRVLGHISMAMLVRDAGPQALMLAATAGLTFLGPPKALMVFEVFLGLSLCALCAIAVLSGRRMAALLIGLPRGAGWRRRGQTAGDAPKAARAAQTSPLGFWGSTITATLWAQIDILLAAFFVSPSVLGQYQIIKRIANLSSVPQIVANWATVVPVGKAFAAGRTDEIQSHCRRALRLSLGPLALLLLGTCVLMPVLIALFDLSATPTTWTLLGLLLASSAVNVLAGPNFTVAAQCHLEGSALIARLAGVATTAGLILILGGLGEIAIAATVLAGSFIANTLIWYRIRRSIRVDTSIYSMFHIKMPR